MSNFNKRELLEIMAAIAPGRGVAEHESDDETVFLKNFLPIPIYRRVLELDTLLVLGGRGVGKTELFRLLANESGRQTLVKSMKIRGLPPLEQTIWLPGFGRTKKRGKQFPTPETVASAMKNADILDWRTFWIGLILGVILQHNPQNLNSHGLNHTWDETIPEQIREILTNRLSLLSDWLPLARENLEKLNDALDRLDEELIEADQWLFIIYDELDRLVPAYAELADPIRELLAFWLYRWRRWERIRPKIFLRTDLFREDFLGVTDASKMRAHQIRLEWTVSWLYQLLVKRLANSETDMAHYLQTIPHLIKKSHSSLLGLLPTSDDSRFELLMETMVGKFMGSNPRKGYTYRWIPNHLQDAGGRIAPRSFLKLFSLAAERRLTENEATLAGDTLLHPSDLQGSLMETSKDRIRELTQEEYPWLSALHSSLNGLDFPIENSKLVKAIENTEWSETPGKQPPTFQATEVLKYLLQLGILESRLDGRLNMPEIYLYGFKAKRRGGVKRPKSS
jgi:hypothetical protein